jgi:hypothetical protein
MDSLKFHPGPPCSTLLCPMGGPSLKGLVAGVARLQNGLPATIFYHFGHPMPYAYGQAIHLLYRFYLKKKD